jgi:hypothetical protein
MRKAVYYKEILANPLETDEWEYTFEYDEKLYNGTSQRRNHFDDAGTIKTYIDKRLFLLKD